MPVWNPGPWGGCGCENSVGGSSRTRLTLCLAVVLCCVVWQGGRGDRCYIVEEGQLECLITTTKKKWLMPDGMDTSLRNLFDE